MPNELEELTLRQMPYSPVSEQAVLGAILGDPRCVADIIDKPRRFLHPEEPGNF